MGHPPQLPELTVGAAVELRWTESVGGDGEWYEATVKRFNADGSIRFAYLGSAGSTAVEEETLTRDELTTARLRPARRRRSVRPRKELKFSYRDLESGLVVRRKDTAEFAAMLLAPPGPTCAFRPDNLRRVDGSKLCRALLESNGFRIPMVVQNVERIPGMRMPHGLTVEKIADLVGQDVVMPVLDVGPQEELSMSLADWVQYWRDPVRERRLNVTSLEITGTRLAALVTPPGVVRELDWIDTIWPQQLKSATLDRLARYQMTGTSKFGTQEVNTVKDLNCLPTAGLDPCAMKTTTTSNKRDAATASLIDNSAPRKRAVLDLQLEDSAPAQVNDADGTGALLIYAERVAATGAVQAKRQVARRESAREKLGREQSQALRERMKWQQETSANLAKQEQDFAKQLLKIEAKKRQKTPPMRGLKSGSIDMLVSCSMIDQMAVTKQTDSAGGAGDGVVTSERREAQSISKSEIGSCQPGKLRVSWSWEGQKSTAGQLKLQRKHAAAVVGGDLHKVTLPPQIVCSELPKPAQLRRWTRASQIAFWHQRVKFWGNQSLKICTEACNRRGIWAGGDAIFLQDRLLRWEFLGQTGLNAEELAAYWVATAAKSTTATASQPQTHSAPKVGCETSFDCSAVDEAMSKACPPPALSTFSRLPDAYRSSGPPLGSLVDVWDAEDCVWLPATVLTVEQVIPCDTKCEVQEQLSFVDSHASASVSHQTSKMTNVCSDKCRVRIRYDGWGSEWDDWVTAPWTEHLARRGRGPHRNQDGTARERHKMQALCRVQQLYFGMGRLQRRTSMSCTPDTMFSSVDQPETTKQRLESWRKFIASSLPRYSQKSCAEDSDQIALAVLSVEDEADADWARCRRGSAAVRSQVSAVLGCIVRAVVQDAAATAAEVQRRRRENKSRGKVLVRRKRGLIAYPKVQIYVLMGTAGSYTDFHIDFGGTSVWYHILQGSKIFYVLPPTKANYRAFEAWSSAPSQSAIFFPDIAPGPCIRVHLKAGDTFLIPPGWIHGVYTPVDSIVFGGNFLHSQNIGLQLQTYALELRLGVPERQQFPFFQEMHWRVAHNFVLRWRSHLAASKRAAARERAAESLKHGIGAAGHLLTPSHSEIVDDQTRKEQPGRKSIKKPTKKNSKKRKGRGAASDSNTGPAMVLKWLSQYEIVGLCQLVRFLSDWLEKGGPRQSSIPETVAAEPAGAEGVLAELKEMTDAVSSPALLANKACGYFLDERAVR